MRVYESVSIRNHKNNNSIIKFWVQLQRQLIWEQHNDVTKYWGRQRIKEEHQDSGLDLPNSTIIILNTA
jgi:hypothetical protein